MITIRNILSVFMLLAIVAFTAGAEETKEPAKADAPVKLKSQTHCPVMGGGIDSTVYTDIQGQRVYHCCPGCAESLKADPDKYFEKAAAEGVLFENVQTHCPVGGEELTSKALHTDYEGRRLLFCGTGCVDGFHKNPKKYLKGMDAAPRGKEDKKSTEHGAQGHSCKNHS